MPAPLEERVQLLEEQTAKLREQGAAPKEKDVWDKLSALSALISGVIIAGLGIWVNITLTNGQQRAQDAQAEATRSMEKAHNETLDRQSSHALDLQERQAGAALAFQRQQAKDQQALEELKMRQQSQQAADVLKQQRAHDDAALKLETMRFENDTIAQIDKEASPDTRIILLGQLAKTDPQKSVELSKQYLETSADPSLRRVAAGNLAVQQKSLDPALRRAASDAIAEAAISKRVQAIINIFESGKQTRNYGAIGGLRQGLQFSYGGFLTLGNGKLYTVIQSYCVDPKARDAAALAPFLDRIRLSDLSLADDVSFKSALVTAGTDAVMQKIQDGVFDDVFWKPAQTRASGLSLKLPLSMAVLFDSFVQGGVTAVTKGTSDQCGGSPADGIDEKRWIATYLDQRITYLERRAPLTTYRPKALQEIVTGGNWNLDPPLTVRDVAITE